MATSAANPLATGVTAELYRAAIGPRGQDYYLRQFMRFDAEGGAGASWHWPAYCCTFNWFVYRKMWGWALGYVAAVLGLVLLIFGVGKLVFDYSDTSALLLFLGLLTAAFVVPALYANAWFYRHCTERITAALRSTGEVKDACEVLLRQAPDSRRLIGLAVGNAALLAMALGVVNWFQGTDSGQPILAARDERALVAGGQSGQVRPLISPPVARVASAPAPVASAPAVAASPSPTSTVVVTSAATAPPVAQAVSAPATAPVVPAEKLAASAGKSPLVNTADSTSTPIKPEPAVLPARPPRAAAAAPAPEPVAAPAPVAATEPAPSATARPAASPNAPRVRYVWVIQVGAYAQPENAQNALAQVQSLGLDAGAETFESAKGPLTRVRVGPYTRQAEAEQAALRIKTLNLPVLVIRQRP